MSLTLRWCHRFEMCSRFVDEAFLFDLSKSKDISKLHTFVHQLHPDHLLPFMRRLHSTRTDHRYAIDTIKYAFAQTKEHTKEHTFLGDILRITFDHVRYTMYRAWDETIDTFKTNDLKKLNELLDKIYSYEERGKTMKISADTLFYLFHVRTLSVDALEYLLLREKYGTPHYKVRSEIVHAARCFACVIDPGLSVNHQSKCTSDLYHYSDTKGNTIAHHIANGTLFPGIGQIDLHPIEDRSLFALTNFAGQTVEEVYRARFAREAQTQSTVPL